MTAMVAVSLARMFNMDNTVGVAAGDRFELWAFESSFLKGNQARGTKRGRGAARSVTAVRM